MNVNKNHLKDYVVWLMAVTVLLWSSVAFGETFYVPGNHATIQDAISAAQDYDEVVVADGIYTGQNNRGLKFEGKKITLRSENGPKNCIIDSEGQYTALVFLSRETPETQVVGFTIRNGYFSSGGAMYCSNSSSPTIRNCIFEGNGAGNGGAVYCAISSPTFINCIFTGNSASSGGGAIYFNYQSNGKLIHCTFSDNTAGMGQAIYCFYSSPSIVNSILWNDTSENGTEIYLFYNSNPDVAYSDVRGGWDGEGNLDSDPILVGNGDVHLSEGSPCIDMGSSSVELPEFDFEGDSRVLGQGPDMGADESAIKAPLALQIAIKPGGNPNSINLKSRGLVPVAVLTTETFQKASAIDLESIEFAEAKAVRWCFRDVDRDGDDDVLFLFKTQELNLDEESTEATLTGRLMDGTEIVGTDQVRIVPAREGKAKHKCKAKHKGKGKCKGKNK